MPVSNTQPVVCEGQLTGTQIVGGKCRGGMFGIAVCGKVGGVGQIVAGNVGVECLGELSAGKWVEWKFCGKLRGEMSWEISGD